MALILVADDDNDILALVELTLVRDGHRVLTVADGQAALAAVHAHQPDAVLLDIDMPGLDGYAVCRAIRNHPYWATTPVAMVSARLHPSDRTPCPAGSNAQLPKPYRMTDLRTLVGHLLQGPAPATS